MGTSARVAEPQARSRGRPEQLAEEQAALRRVATLVASGAPSTEVFSAVVREVVQVMQLPMVGLYRYDRDGMMTVIAAESDRPHVFEAGTRWPLEGESMVEQVRRTGRPVRVEDYAELPGELAAAARDSRLNATAGAPIVVDGSVWGAMGVASPDGPLPDQAEHRLAEFTELVATAIANSQTHEELERLASEQAALRRVATLAAEGATVGEVAEAVGAEVGQLVDADGAGVSRYDDDGMFTVLGGWARDGGYTFTGRRLVFEGSMSGVVFETGRPSRIDSFEGRRGEAPAEVRKLGWRSAAGAPIMVEGRPWGVLLAYSKRAEPLSLQTEDHLAKFTEIVATAVASTENREQITRLAEEQAALRRVATLVASGAQPAEVFEAVSAEVGRLVPADVATISRYDADGTVTVLGRWTRHSGYSIRTGVPSTLEPGTTRQLVYDTHRPARVDTYEGDSLSRLPGVRSGVGAPIIVEGRVWGVANIGSVTEWLPADAAERLMQFTELVATAIANAESRAELEASRSRIVATADATRRRIERDLHDGAQQRLLSLALELRAAQTTVPAGMATHRAELSHVAEGLTDVLDGLREIALGLHPAILAEGGLRAALKTLAQRSPIPVSLDVQADKRLPEHVEVAAYYIVSEALTNTAKHARAAKVDVVVVVRDRVLSVAVADDGVGGADPARGSGLLGLTDRAAAIGGSISVQSPPGRGTSLVAELPLVDSSG